MATSLKHSTKSFSRQTDNFAGDKTKILAPNRRSDETQQKISWQVNVNNISVLSFCLKGQHLLNLLYLKSIVYIEKQVSIQLSINGLMTNNVKYVKYACNSWDNETFSQLVLTHPISIVTAKLLASWKTKLPNMIDPSCLPWLQGLCRCFQNFHAAYLWPITRGKT